MKKQTVFRSLVAIVVIGFTLTMSSCKKDNTDIQAKIKSIIPQQYLDSLTKYGMIYNSGTTPPNVDGIFEFAWQKLEASNIPGDQPYIGMEFGTYRFKFENQDNAKLTNNAAYKYYQRNASTASESATSTQSYVTGSGDNFTVYFTVNGTITSGSQTGTYVSVYILTATKSGTSFINPKAAFIVVSKNDPDNIVIDPGQLRISSDSNGESPTTTVF